MNTKQIITPDVRKQLFDKLVKLSEGKTKQATRAQKILNKLRKIPEYSYLFEKVS